MINKLAILLIRFYERFISPRKGFHCAHREMHGGDTCSVAVRKIIEINGLYSGFRLIQRRFAKSARSHPAEFRHITEQV